MLALLTLLNAGCAAATCRFQQGLLLCPSKLHCCQLVTGQMLAALAMVVPADRPWQMAKSPELAFDHNCDIENCLGSGHPAAQSCWMI